jgi:hypothetical protein
LVLSLRRSNGLVEFYSMRKFKDAGRKPATPSRSNTTSSIRGKISAPIPISTADDEFPIRTPGTGIAMPLDEESLEREPRAAPTPLQLETAKQEEAGISAPAEELSRAAPSAPPSTAPSHENPAPHARQVSPLRGSGVSNPSGSSIEKPQRKKSTLRSVLVRLFGKKRKSDSSAKRLHGALPREGQHRSVSITRFKKMSCKLTKK